MGEGRNRKTGEEEGKREVEWVTPNRGMLTMAGQPKNGIPSPQPPPLFALGRQPPPNNNITCSDPKGRTPALNQTIEEECHWGGSGERQIMGRGEARPLEQLVDH